MQETRNPIQVAERLFQTLEILADAGPLTLAELQSRLPLNKSTLHRLLASLHYMGYVTQEEGSGKYGLSFKLLALSSKLLDKMDILDAIRPFLKKLSEETGETVHLVFFDGKDAVYIAKEISYRNSIRMVSRIGSHIPLYCSGVGKALLAEMSENQISDYWNHTEIKKFTEHTITTCSDLQNALNQIRKQGYALDNEEHEPGVRCIAVSLPWYNRPAEYALSISAPIHRMPDHRVRELALLLLDLKKEFISLHSFSVQR